MSLAGRVALITGSTSGIGLGIAKSFASKGAEIVLNGFATSEAVYDLSKEIHDSYGVRVHYDGANLANPGEIESMFSNITKATHGRNVDILVNNAGIQFTAPTEKFPVESWDAIMAINLSAVFHTTRLALPSMQEKNWGRIINIASVHGLVGSMEKSAYVAAKHGVVGMTKVVALENAHTHITANCICPGWVLTPLVEKQIENLAIKHNISFEEAKFKLLSAKQPSASFVTPDQLGELSCFLSSEAASEVRGQAWAMDGGWTAQ